MIEIQDHIDKPYKADEVKMLIAGADDYLV